MSGVHDTPVHPHDIHLDLPPTIPAFDAQAYGCPRQFLVRREECSSSTTQTPSPRWYHAFLIIALLYTLFISLAIYTFFRPLGRPLVYLAVMYYAWMLGDVIVKRKRSTSPDIDEIPMLKKHGSQTRPDAEVFVGRGKENVLISPSKCLVYDKEQLVYVIFPYLGRNLNTTRMNESIEAEQLDEFGNPESTQLCTKCKWPNPRPKPTENSDPEDEDYATGAGDNDYTLSSDSDIKEVLPNDEVAHEPLPVLVHKFASS
ncbi:hypothetical protein B0H13DRAFT_1880198 [Mycena leptocephala]|nr:hypothetical protein B0H13DRAFT_1880198 [Mycena leptocephala]